MLIANPLFDSAFKFLMKDLKVARYFLSVLLNREIEIEGFEATEDDLINQSRETGFSTQRMDFHATLIEENGIKRKVLIELQKSPTLTDISRFRRYLAKAYYDTDTLPKNAEHNEIISIYILGFKLNTPVAVVKTSTKLIDASTQELLDANTDDDTFMRKLHHESIFIDTTKLTHKMQNRVDRLLAVFNQDYITDNKYSLDIPLDNFPKIDEELCLLNRLNYALLDKELRHELSVQAEYQLVVENSQKQAQYEGETKAKIEIAKSMKNEGDSIEKISRITGLTQEQIDKL